MARVVMRNLNKKFDDFHAVKNVSLDIRDKEFMVIVGPSGPSANCSLKCTGRAAWRNGPSAASARSCVETAPIAPRATRCAIIRRAAICRSAVFVPCKISSSR